MLEYVKITIFFCVLLTVVSVKGQSYNQTLPAFNVQAHQATVNETLDLAQNLFGPDDYYVTFSYDESRYIVLSSDGTKRVEFDIRSGGVWATDESEIWNTDGPAPNLLSDSEAISMADAVIAKLNLLPTTGDGPVKVSGGRIGGTFLAHECGSGHGSGGYEREEYPLDVSVNYDIILVIDDNEFPIVGGGGKFQVTFGSSGKLIAFQGLWRDIVGQTFHTIASQEDANGYFEASAEYLNGTLRFTSFLAYYSEPFGVSQSSMNPGYVFTGTSQVQNENITIRPEARHAQWNFPRSLDKRDVHHARSSDDSKLEAATEWLGKPYGLSMSKQNAKGFRDGIAAATNGWTFKYDRSNKDVLECDFTTDDDRYADSVDMLFYTGHANQNGWLANKPGITAVVPELVEYTSFGTRPENPGDLLGQQDLEWLMIAACGPHQHTTFDPGAGNVFDRWRGIFDGLHIMFAYGGDSYDTVMEGELFTKYSREGYRLIDSWFRMAKEAQPPGVIVTAMWADGPGGNARNDHLPGYGWVSGDNVGKKQCRWFMWTTT